MILVEQRQLLDAGGNDPTDEQQTAYGALEQEYERVSAELIQENALAEKQKDLRAVSWDSDDPVNCRRAQQGLPSIATETPAGGGRGSRYSEVFGIDADHLSSDGWNSFDEFLGTIHAQIADERLRPAVGAVMQEGMGSTGGFSVPTEFAGWLLDSSLENEIVRPRASVWPMKSATRKVCLWDGATHTSTRFGGLAAAWTAESGTLTAQDAALRQIELNAKKCGIYGKVSNELIRDGDSFESQLKDAFVRECGWTFDYAFLQGTGAGQPLGILNAASKITASKESGQAASTIVYENLCAMYARCHPMCRRKAYWIANDAAIPQLLTLAMDVGTSGAAYPVMKEDSGRFFIFGREVLFTEKVPTLGTEGDIMLVDLSQYVIGLRQQLVVDKSMHVGFATDETGYRCVMRADGMAAWSAAVTPKAGDTLSWAVTLEDR